jgi:uncharacterized protein (DUF1330 family)
MAGYWIVRGEAIKDQAAFDEYGKAWGPIAKRFGARVLVGGKRHQVREGADCARVVVVEFPSYEQAIACYDDPEYRKAILAAHRAYTRDLVIVEGI